MNSRHDVNTARLEPTRSDLISGSTLLKPLVGTIKLTDGKHSDLVIAAPHEAEEGSPLASGHDVNTGLLAREVAAHLEARSVVVSELRTFVDINKSPGALDESSLPRHPGKRSQRQADEALKLYYQSQLFRGQPCVVVELHGFRGARHFDIEASPGYAPSADTSQDQVLAVCLRVFKRSLERALEKNFPDKPPRLGVFPIDEEVYFRATQTYTFERVRLLRDLGENVYGLHIELEQSLRRGLLKDPTRCRKLVRSLGAGIINFLHECRRQRPVESKPGLRELLSEPVRSYKPLGRELFRVGRAPRELIHKDVAVFAPRDLRRAHLLHGDEVGIAGSERSSPVVVRAWEDKESQPRSIRLSQRLRKKLGVEPGDGVRLFRIESAEYPPGLLAYLQELEGHSQDRVELPTRRLKEIPKLASGPARITTTRGDSASARVRPDAGTNLTGRGIRLSLPLARKLGITYGDVVLLEPTKSPEDGDR